MALGDSYATTVDLKKRIDLPDDDTSDDDRLDEALTTASREIETWCRRQFNTTDTPTARVYAPSSAGLLTVDDFHTTSGLEVATGDGYTTVWSATDFQVEPLNGIVSGQPGWPYWRIRALNRSFDPCPGRPTVQVTAQWGWAEVPGPVKEACLVAAAELFKLGDAPFGVAGYGEYGPVRVRMNSRAQSLLAPYRLNPIMVG